MSSDLSPNLIVNQQISKEHELAPVLDRAPTYSPPPDVTTTQSAFDDSVNEDVDVGLLPLEIAEIWDSVFVPSLVARYSTVSESNFPMDVDELIPIIRVAFMSTYPDEISERYVENIVPGEVIFELSMQKLHEYRGRFLGIAAVAVHKFFTRSYYDYNEGLKYCFQTPESIRAFVRSILSPSGARGSFHWAHWYSSHSRHGAYENPLLLEILAKAHFRQVEGANTFSFPRQEPIQALVLALVALNFAFELWSEGTPATDSTMASLECWDWDAIAKEHAEAFENHQAAYGTTPSSANWDKIVSGVRKFM
ncbi:uncharacterized protein STEHIDRAFT_160234 [Stereum hirsutum FP-91666 SS1]|uniref:uncharacterized protein n=1 Tax=Stereum hirsutum (strain FP-91666) TaxID=721885 RepID=UPI000444A03D|nr:uncharacterized protein STEHIDRAFT_160234 [Stereum hirsutum FP-91666 SS1]EIM83660.1 hypothetical protein STEHIDRAFT_160234 [Stereum hirsutum FP-91666 SS1]